MKKVSSVVWQFFDRLEENKRCVAVLCKLCDSEYKYFGNTTNLRAHLIKKHPIQWEFRQNNTDGQKLDESSPLKKRIIFDDDESTNQSTVQPKRRKYTRAHIDKNVDVLETRDEEDDVATHNLVRQMHNQGSDEEWLEEDYQQVELYEPKRKKVSYAKIKREVVSPPRRSSNYFVRNTKPEKTERERVIVDDYKKDEYSVFGEYIANKLRKFKAPRTRGNIQQLITTILWQAEYGTFDEADSVKRILMCAVEQKPAESNVHTEQDIEIRTNETQHDEVVIEEQRVEEPNQSIESASEF